MITPVFSSFEVFQSVLGDSLVHGLILVDWRGALLTRITRPGLSTGLIDGRRVNGNGIKATSIFLKGHHVMVWISSHSRLILWHQSSICCSACGSVWAHRCRSEALSSDLCWIFAQGFTVCQFIDQFIVQNCVKWYLQGGAETHDSSQFIHMNPHWS